MSEMPLLRQNFNFFAEKCKNIFFVTFVEKMLKKVCGKFL
jgi:hypothetical protein